MELLSPDRISPTFLHRQPASETLALVISYARPGSRGPSFCAERVIPMPRTRALTKVLDLLGIEFIGLFWGGPMVLGAVSAYAKHPGSF